MSGTLYNVVFKDNTINGVFGSAANLDASSLGRANTFSTALINSVFLDNSYASFNSQPFNIFGCSDFFYCEVLTPYNIGNFDFSASIARNRNAGLGSSNVVSNTGPFAPPKFMNLRDNQ